MTARKVRVGDLVEVLDASPAKNGRKPKFAKGDVRRVTHVSPVSGYAVERAHGYWSASRFALRTPEGGA